MPINESTKFELLGIVEQLRDAILKAAGEDIPSVPGPVPAPAKPITSVIIENTGGDQTNVPVTFGQVFAPGDLPAGMGLKDAQLDVKATHPDGSVRHGIVSLIVPKLAKGDQFHFDLVPAPLESHVSRQVNFVDALVSIRHGDKEYLAMPLAFNAQRWLSGELVSELRYAPELLGEGDVSHPHLAVIFSVRSYSSGKVRVEIIVENTWAYAADPRNINYDVEIAIDEKVVLEKKGFEHYHHARWRHVAWVGEEPKFHVRHDPAYWMATGAVPNYDPGIVIDEKTLAGYAKGWSGPKTQPMGVGLAMRSMGTTGGRPDIGTLTGWNVAWLLSQDPRAALVSLGTADLAGSWSYHYRDKNTGMPVSLFDYPYITINGKSVDAKNPKTKLYEIVPALKKDTSATPNKFESAHQPDLCYLAYLMTGDYYYLEEVQFSAMWNITETNPAFRGYSQGLVNRTQLRGEAWIIRSLLHAEYASPDAHPLKDQFRKVLSNNFTWYKKEFVDNPDSNKLGIVTGYLQSDVDYEAKTSIPPWQLDFLASQFGRAIELGHDEARPIFEWMSKFTVARMLAPGVCYIFATRYTMKIRDSQNSPIYETMNQVYEASVGKEIAGLPCGDVVSKALGIKSGQMLGSPQSAVGTFANYQPALALAVDYGPPEARKAYEMYKASATQPNFGRDGAQFAIVPRAN